MLSAFAVLLRILGNCFLELRPCLDDWIAWFHGLTWMMSASVCITAWALLYKASLCLAVFQTQIHHSLSNYQAKLSLALSPEFGKFLTDSAVGAPFDKTPYANKSIGLRYTQCTFRTPSSSLLSWPPFPQLSERAAEMVKLQLALGRHVHWAVLTAVPAVVTYTQPSTPMTAAWSLTRARTEIFAMLMVAGLLVTVFDATTTTHRSFILLEAISAIAIGREPIVARFRSPIIMHLGAAAGSKIYWGSCSIVAAKVDFKEE